MDVVATKDGALITVHDLTLDATTNVADIERFRGRNATKHVPHVGDVQGYFVIDFTLEEIKELTVRQALPFRDHSLDGQYRVPTLLEVLTVVKKARGNGTNVGAYIESKEPDFHHQEGVALERLMVEDVAQSGLLGDLGALYLQSFSRASLVRLSDQLEERGVSVPMSWLLGCSNPPSKAALKRFAQFGTAIGPSKVMLVEMEWTPECGRPRDSKCSDFSAGQDCVGRLKRDENGSVILSPLVPRAREAGLQIHAYTFRNEAKYMALDFLADPLEELEFYTDPRYGIELDGFFLDCPETVERADRSSPPASVAPSVNTLSAPEDDRASGGSGWAIGFLIAGWAAVVVACFVYFFRGRGSRYADFNRMMAEDGDRPG